MELSNPWPDQYKITPTRRFGMVWHPIYRAMRFHHGVDVRGAFPLLVPHDGVVKHIGWDPEGGGNVLGISHEGVETIPGVPVGPTSIVTFYYHGRDRTNLSLGQSVTRGELMYHSGSTGFSTGDHCHMEVRRGPNGTWGDTLNPEHYLNGKVAETVLEINGKLDSATWKAWQIALKDFGLYSGAIDGIPGKLSYSAIQRWADAPETEKLDDATKIAVQKRLGVKPDAIWGSATITELQKELLQGLAGPKKPDPLPEEIVDIFKKMSKGLAAFFRKKENLR
jgi:hypothetical protein